MIRLKNHQAALTSLPLVVVGDPLRSALRSVPQTYQKLSRKSSVYTTFLSLVIRVTANRNTPTNMKEMNIVTQISLENGERNWNGQTLLSGFFTTTLVPFVMNGSVKSTTSDRSGVILKGARATSALCNRKMTFYTVFGDLFNWFIQNSNTPRL